MGDKATSSSGSFSGAATIHIDLLGGESGGKYTCARDSGS